MSPTPRRGVAEGRNERGFGAAVLENQLAADAVAVTGAGVNRTGGKNAERIPEL